MWSNIQTVRSQLLKCSTWIINPKRTTYVLERLNKVRLNKLGTDRPKKLKRREYYYRVLYNTDSLKRTLLDVVLLQDVAGVGMAGEKIQVNPYVGYTELLLPKLATYADAVDIEAINLSKEKSQTSSKYSKIIEKFLIGRALAIVLNPQVEWTLEPWHVKVALRCEGLLVNEDCIKLPDQKISGPNIEIENKDFPVQLTLNKTEKFYIRARIFQATSGQKINTSVLLKHDRDPLFPEDKELIDSLRKIEDEIRRRKM